MSLDISLIKKGKVTYDEGKTFEEYQEEVFSENITHNLGTMADKAGLYNALWNPDKIKASKAKHLLTPLIDGINKLESDPEYFKTFSPSNGWGTYAGLVSISKRYLDACTENPEAFIEVSG